MYIIYISVICVDVECDVGRLWSKTYEKKSTKVQFCKYTLKTYFLYSSSNDGKHACCVIA